MFNIGQYLHRLLLIHQEVGLPGIGIFKSERIPAGFDEIKNIFFPPSNLYSLIEHEQVDHFLLADVSRHLNLTPSDANVEIEKATAKLLMEVSEKGEATLDKIGYLKELNGKYILVSFSDRYWGLQPVKEIFSGNSTDEFKIDESQTLHEKNLTMQASVVDAMQEELSPEEKSGNSKIWVWSIAALLLITASVFLWYNKKDQPKPLPKTTANIQVNKSPSANVVADSQIQSKDTLQKALDTASIKKKPLVQKASKELPYSIVLGSFKTMDLAIKQAEYFRTIGIEAFVLESKMPHNRKKICYGLYATKEEARKQLDRVRSEINQEAYIYP